MYVNRVIFESSVEWPGYSKNNPVLVRHPGNDHVWHIPRGETVLRYTHYAWVPTGKSRKPWALMDIWMAPSNFSRGNILIFEWYFPLNRYRTQFSSEWQSPFIGKWNHLLSMIRFHGCTYLYDYICIYVIALSYTCFRLILYTSMS